VGGVTSTAFGLLIAYLLPGLISLYGLSFWSSTVGMLFSTFLTTQSNAALFILVLLAALIAGLFAGLIRWLLLDMLLCRWLFRRERVLFPFTRLRSPALAPPSSADYPNLAKGETLLAYRAFIDETYRYYQFWGATAIAMPVLLLGWLRSQAISGSQLCLLLGLLFLAEIAILVKALESWVNVARGHAAILKGGEDASSSN
jgi:hypothetical protein